MNVTMEKYNAKRIYGIPPGLKDLMTDITREVLREQPINIYLFIANYLEALLDARTCCRAATKTVANTIEYGEILANITEMYGIDIPTAHEACAKIQAAYRGHRTRIDLLHKGGILQYSGLLILIYFIRGIINININISGLLSGRKFKKTICYVQ